MTNIPKKIEIKSWRGSPREVTEVESRIGRLEYEHNQLIDYLSDPETIVKNYNDLLDSQHEPPESSEDDK